MCYFSLFLYTIYGGKASTECPEALYKQKKNNNIIKYIIKDII